METGDTLLRYSLRANAAFSILTGGAMMIASGALGDWMGVPAAVVFWVGVVVFANAFSITAQSLPRSMPRPAVMMTIGGDVAWVVASVVVAIWRPGAMTIAGVDAILAVAAVVAGFAIAQMVGLQRAASLAKAH